MRSMVADPSAPRTGKDRAVAPSEASIDSIAARKKRLALRSVSDGRSGASQQISLVIASIKGLAAMTLPLSSKTKGRKTERLENQGGRARPFELQTSRHCGCACEMRTDRVQHADLKATRAR